MLLAIDAVAGIAVLGLFAAAARATRPARRRERSARERAAWCERTRRLLDLFPAGAQRVEGRERLWAMWGAANELFTLERRGAQLYVRSCALSGRRAA
jgi:hypothetical protein